MRPVVVHARLAARSPLPPTSSAISCRAAAAYVHDNGEEIPVEAGTLVFFPAGWTGTSIVTETLTKAFMCR